MQIQFDRTCPSLLLKFLPRDQAANSRLTTMRYRRLRSMQSLDQRMQRVVVRRQELARRWDALRNNDLLQLLVVTLPGLLRAERCGLFVLDPDADELWLEAGTGVMQRQICADLDGSMVGACVRTGTCVNRSGLEQLQGAHQQAGEALSYAVSTAMTVPMA